MNPDETPVPGFSDDGAACGGEDRRAQLRDVVDKDVGLWMDHTEANGYTSPLPSARQQLEGDATVELRLDQGILAVEGNQWSGLDLHSHGGDVTLGLRTSDDVLDLGLDVDPDAARALAEGLLWAAELADRDVDGTVF